MCAMAVVLHLLPDRLLNVEWCSRRSFERRGVLPSHVTGPLVWMRGRGSAGVLVARRQPPAPILTLIQTDKYATVCRFAIL